MWILDTHRSQRNGDLIGLMMVPYIAQPFVTCIITDINKGTWVSGHYFDVINEAVADFLERS